MRLYFDTETTGIPDRNLPWNHERQPRIVSLAVALVDNEWNEVQHYHSLVTPVGWSIDPEGKAFAAHRITQERCKAEGKPIAQVLGNLIAAIELNPNTEICAYNIDFDVNMTRIEAEKNKLPWINFPPRLDILPLAQIVCQMPPTDRMRASGRNGFKPPKLSEALHILCGEDFPDAHDALADVRATIKIHRVIEELRNGNG